jgi:hypothetical protein
MHEYHLEKSPRDDTTFSTTIDWGANDPAIKSLTIPDHQFVTKFMFQLLPLGVRLHQ